MTVVKESGGARLSRRLLARARGPILATIASVVTIAALSIAVIGGIADPTTLIGSGATFFYVIPGLVLLVRRNWHIVGWLLILIGLTFSVTYSGAAIYSAGYLQWGDPAWFAWVFDNWSYAAAFACLVALVTVFPDGLHRRSAWQKIVGRITLCMAVLMIVLAMLIAEVGGETVSVLLPNPTGLGVFPQWIGEIVVLIALLLIAISILGFWLRYRRTTGAERAQYRWVGYAFALVIVGTISGLIASIWIDSASPVPWILAVASYYLVPVAFMLAILRLGLYEIDRIVSRTMTYAAVVLTVALVYAIPVVILPRVLGESNDLVVAGSTLLAAAAFNPVRRRIQHAVDHRFNRARFDAEHQLELFSADIHSDTDLESIGVDLNRLVADTVAPAKVSLWIR